MASNQTENYQLSQWAASDQVLRTDFNADNAKIDAAIKAAADLAQGANQKADAAYGPENSPFVVGTYTGDGAVTRVISLGFTPRAVLVTSASGATMASEISDIYYGGLAMQGYNAASTNNGRTSWVDGDTILAVVTGGFQIGYSESSYIYVFSNEADAVRYYIAFR